MPRKKISNTSLGPKTSKRAGPFSSLRQNPTAATGSTRLKSLARPAPTEPDLTNALVNLHRVWPANPRLKETSKGPAAPKQSAAQLAVVFSLVKANAKQVSLCGEFNGWSPGVTPMNRKDDGHWEVSIPLAPGRYQYKFVADGEWLADPSAPNSVRNEYGSFNSVVEVRV
jgi:hypothetical protein